MQTGEQEGWRAGIFFTNSIATGIVAALLWAALASCTNSHQSAYDLYKFPGTKDVQVQVKVDYKLDAGGGPAVAIAQQNFLLNAFLLQDTSQQIPIAYLGQTPVNDLPVTLTGTHLTFDALARVPVALQPGQAVTPCTLI